MKAGQDAETICVVDVWWTASGELRRAVSAVPASCFEPEPAAAAFVAAQQDFLSSLTSTPITTLPAACSSKRVRYEPSGLSTFLLTLLKRGLATSSGVELVLLQGARILLHPPVSACPPARGHAFASCAACGALASRLRRSRLPGGAFRGQADYAAGPFTLGDLYREIGFETQQAVLPLPGRILAASIASSRTGDGEKPNYLHADEGCAFDDETHTQLLTINGEPLDEEREYVVAIYQFLLGGMNAIEPLVSYVSQRADELIPPLESCLPAKEIAMSVCVRDAWARVLRSDTWDTNEDGSVDEVELAAAVSSAFAELDLDADGYLSAAELTAVLERPDSSAFGVSAALVARLIELADQDGDGLVSRQELAQVACSIRNEEGACVFV